ncbi:MAG TPA: YoaK family protein [Streptosporangiaceae bacterium]|nr:YoaK family protein [Streptosporangiaceae bacterium]
MSPGERAPGAWALTIVAGVLTIGSAATDIMAITRLGNVFASVMTSNIVFLGLAAARHSGTLAVHAAVSFAGYAAGVFAGSRLSRHPAGGGADGAAGPWTPWVTAALAAEAAVLVGFTIGWEVTGARPTGGAQLLLIALATIAMGLQSAVVVVLNISGVGTTYLTGTLTSLIDSLASPGPERGTAQRREANRRRAVALAALVAGALLAGLLISAAPRVVPAIPLAALATVLIIGRPLLDAPGGPG